MQSDVADLHRRDKSRGSPVSGSPPLPAPSIRFAAGVRARYTCLSCLPFVLSETASDRAGKPKDEVEAADGIRNSTQ